MNEIVNKKVFKEAGKETFFVLGAIGLILLGAFGNALLSIYIVVTFGLDIIWVYIISIGLSLILISIIIFLSEYKSRIGD